MTVVLRVLGPLDVEVDGARADLGGPGRRAVLARLAVAGGDVVATDRLLDDLWRGAPPPRASGALQVHVSHLRRALEPERAPRSPARVLVSLAPGYALRLPDAAQFDAAAATLLVARARDEDPAAAVATLRAALAYWRGGAYAEFADEPWARAEAARLDELALVARERLAAAELELGAHLEAVPALEGHVRAHPLREEGVRLLVTALHRGGRSADALALLRRTRTRLRDELGLDPGPALVDLETAVLDPPAARPRPAPAPAPARGPEAPLGRDPELALLSGAARRAAGGGVELALVAGEAGAGKTTLVDALVDRCARDGWTVARGRCPEVDGAPPAWPWTEIGRALDPDVAGLPTPFARGRAIVAALGRSARDRGALLALDDLHRADDETLRLLRMVLAEAPPGLLVVGTHRPEEDSPALQATRAALASVVSVRVDLGGLSVDAVGALMSRHGLRADADAASAVAARTGGNPLFVREVARLAVSGVSGADRRAVPAGVRDVLRRRLRDLPGRARAVLTHVALLGSGADIDVLLAVDAAVERRPITEVEDEVLDALEAAVAAGVLHESDGGRRVGFVHDLWREVLEADVPRLRRARRHAVIVDVLDSGAAADHAGHGGGAVVPVPRAALAHHALAAGDRVETGRVLDHATAAADEAVARGAYRTAVALRRGALERLAAAPTADARSVVALRSALVSALAGAGAGEHAHAERDTTVAAAALLGDPGLLAEALTAVDAPMPWPVRAPVGALVGVFTALLDPQRPDGWMPDDATRVRLLLAFAREIEFTDPERSGALSDEALERARALGDSRILCTALNTAFLVRSQPEYWSRIEPLGRELLSTAVAGGHPDFCAEGHHMLFCAAVVRDDLESARRHADAAIGEATDGQLEMTLAHVGLHDAMRDLLAGRVDDADRAYAEEGARLVAAGVPHAAALLAVARFTVGMARGDTSGSLPDLEAIDAQIPHYVHDLLALALLDAGEEARARAVWARRFPVPRDWSWGGLMTVRGEVAVRLGDRGRAAEAHAALSGWSGRWALSVTGILAFLPIDLVLARLCRALDRPETERLAHLDRAAELVGPDGPWRAQVDSERALPARDVAG